MASFTVQLCLVSEILKIQLSSYVPEPECVAKHTVLEMLGWYFTLLEQRYKTGDKPDEKLRYESETLMEKQCFVHIQISPL